MSDTKNECANSSTLIFACSGAADVGAITDQAARKLTRDGAGSMFCLAGVGGRVEPIMKITRDAEAILAIDGCSMDCVKKCLQEAGMAEVTHLRLTDLGMVKGETDVTEATVEQAAIVAMEKMA